MADAEGYVSIFGRKDDMIISGGENIYLAEVEEALHSHENVEEIVIFGVPDDEWGVIVKAIVVPAGDDDLTRADIREFLDGELADFKHPKAVETADELPKSGTGKLERQQILEEYGAE